MNGTRGSEGKAAAMAVAPKRVAGGLVLKTKKKKKITHHQQIDGAAQKDKDGCCQSAPSSSKAGVPSILTSTSSTQLKDDYNSNDKDIAKSKLFDEFDDTAEFDNNNDEDDIPSDALMCLQTYTRSSIHGGMSESCAYCPIFTNEQNSNDGDNCSGGSSSSSSSSTHAVPFLPQHMLLHLLNNNNTASTMISTRTHIEQEIKQLALSNKVRLLQLHGTAINSSSSNRGDGNDDEDVAVMDINAYIAAAELAVLHYFEAQSTSSASSSIQYTNKVGTVHQWFTTILLPYFAGKKWFSSSALDACYETLDHQQSLHQMKEMIQQLLHAGLLLPRQIISSGGGGGYWFSLPGLGKAAKSIVHGRTNLIRRLQCTQYKEKKRCTLEYEIGRNISTSSSLKKKKKNELQQSGKFVVLDSLAKRWVEVHTTCTGDQFIRLVE